MADLRRLRFSGFVAWLLWLTIHLFWLVGLHNRILVFIRWTYSFFTRGRGNRLITGEGRPAPVSPRHRTEPAGPIDPPVGSRGALRQPRARSGDRGPGDGAVRG